MEYISLRRADDGRASTKDSRRVEGEHERIIIVGRVRRNNEEQRVVLKRSAM